jgi:hypothetical protein
MKKPNVTLTVAGTLYVPVRAVELKRLRAVEKAARAVVDAASHRSIKPVLRKLAQAVRP